MRDVKEKEKRIIQIEKFTIDLAADAMLKSDIAKNKQRAEHF